MEMERYWISVLAVTETHLTGEGEMVLDEGRGYRMLFAGRKDRRAIGVRLAVTPQARASLRHYQPVYPRILVVELLTQMSPLSIVVVYAPNQSSVCLYCKPLPLWVRWLTSRQALPMSPIGKSRPE